MPTSSAYKAWDIVAVPFPYADRLAEKKRPALVVSGAEIGNLGLLWVAMITSAANAGWAGDIPIPAGAGLRSPSVVRPAKIACIDLGRVLYRLGELDQPTAAQVHPRLVGSLAAP